MTDTSHPMQHDEATPSFAPPDGAAWLVPGNVMHARMKPKQHRFTYRVFCLLIDIGKLDAAKHISSVFSVNRANLLSFRESDHGLQDRSAPVGHLRAYIDTLLKPTGLDATGGRVLLLCYPRMLGFVFNPLSVYFVYDRDELPIALIYEVRNTFGEMHTYVCPVENGQMTEAGIRQERDKLFYVSPFVDQPMRYRFRVVPPGEKVSVRILETDAEGPILAAVFVGRCHGLSTASVLKACSAMPFMTFKVVAGIHWEAMKLWFKGIRFYTRPKPPETVSYHDPKPAQTIN